MYSTANEIGREREERYRAIKFLAIIAITAMMAIPIIQHIQNEYASTPVESYSYYNEMVRFVGSDTFIGFDGNLFPVSWNVFEANPNYSPGPQVNPFAVSTNNTNTSAPLIEETFSHYTTKRIESVWQNSAVMIKWNHYVKIAEIFSFTNSGIDASIVVKNLNVTNTYISTFSLGMGINSTMAVNGFNPSCQNISSGTGIIPSNDWNVSLGNISVNWQSEDSIFHSGIVSESQSGDQLILPFETGIINHNQSYTIDPMIYYSPYRIIGGPIHLPSPTPPSPAPTSPTSVGADVSFTESGLPSGTPWYVTFDGSTQTSVSRTITFGKKFGCFSYSVGSPSEYPSNPSSGKVLVLDSSKSVSVSFTAQPYNVSFEESGLSSGTSWYVTLNGVNKSSTTNTIIFSEYYGYYSYTIGSVSGYNSQGGSTKIMVQHGPESILVEYTKQPEPHLYNVSITQSGLPSGTSWSVTLNGVNKSSTTNTITFSEYNGTYSYSIQSVNGYSRTLKSGSISVNGQSRSISVSYFSISNDITFFASGLSNGTAWSVDLNGNTLSSTSSSISFSEPDGSYSYSIGSISGYEISPSSGTANINGGPTTVSVTFTKMIGNFCPTYNTGDCNYYHELITHNLTQAIVNNTLYNSGTLVRYLMLQAETTNITFSIPYSGANKGSGQVNTYASPNNPSVSSDKISGPPPVPFRGMLIYTLTSSGSVGLQIYCNQNLSGNGIVHFSWFAQPGAYGGFMVELVNNNSVARSYYKHPFDVYSNLVTNQTGRCIDDSVASTRVYSSGGVYVGNLIITASEGPSGQNYTDSLPIPLGLTTVFYSPYNDVDANEYTYGILNYNQYLNLTGTQAGYTKVKPVYKPICALNQGASSSDTPNPSTTAAEKSLYDITKTALMLTADPCIMALGITMTALGPFVFPGNAPSNKESYWNHCFNTETSISYGSWDLGNSGSNLPSPENIKVGCDVGVSGMTGVASGYPVNAPVYTLVNNGHGNPSYLQYLNMIIKQQPENSKVNKTNDYILNYFTYSASITVVPIAHSYTFCQICGIRTAPNTYDFSQNDYVNATSNGNGGYIYTGTSYTAAVSLPLYMPFEG